MTLRNVHFGGAAAVLGALMLMASSQVQSSTSLYEAKTVGDYLPKVTITNGRTTGAVQGSKGLTLVHFWAAYDAESRSKQVAYDSFMSKHGDKTMAYQAISLDVDADVYTQTLAFDGVGERANQLMAAPTERARLMELCGLENGFHAYLIDADGKILKVDPTTEELEKFVRI